MWQPLPHRGKLTLYFCSAKLHGWVWWNFSSEKMFCYTTHKDIAGIRAGSIGISHPWGACTCTCRFLLPGVCKIYTIHREVLKMFDFHPSPLLNNQQLDIPLLIHPWYICECRWRMCEWKKLGGTLLASLSTNGRQYSHNRNQAKWARWNVSGVYWLMTCTFVTSPLAGRVEKKCSREIEMYVGVAFCFVTAVNGHVYFFICYASSFRVDIWKESEGLYNSVSLAEKKEKG